MWFLMIYAGMEWVAKCVFSPCRRCFNDPNAEYARPNIMDTDVPFTSATSGGLYYSIV